MIKRIRGFNDWILDDAELFYNSKIVIQSYLKNRGYSFVELPVIEDISLFNNSLGQSSDIVNKEMFEVVQRKENRNWVLRPESTAQIARAFLENKLHKDVSWRTRKFFYFSSLFRYERPQKERFRQFYTIGTEIYLQKNETNREYLFLEMISDLLNLFKKSDLILKINLLPKNRSKYLSSLKEHLESGIQNLCEDCKERMQTNILRILDCKKDRNSSLIQNAPSILNFASKEEKLFLSKIIFEIKKTKWNVVIDPKLVRGLDYYNGIIFEIVEKLNDRHAICGGGEYSGLLESLEKQQSKDIKWSSMGYGIGFERAIKHLKNFKNIKSKILVIKKTSSDEFSNLRDFLLEKYEVFVKQYSRSITKELDWAQKNNFNCFVIVGDDEITNKKLNIRNIATKKEETLIWEEN